jgi:hypothetical protein
VPLFILEKSWRGENPPVIPTLTWKRAERVGEGKARNLDAARASAVWPDATDEELSVEPEDLRNKLQARYAHLMADFRQAMDSIGFLWSPDDYRAAA